MDEKREEKRTIKMRFIWLLFIPKRRKNRSNWNCWCLDSTFHRFRAFNTLWRL